MDEKDKAILNILQASGREQFNKIAEKVGLSNAAIHARIIKLEKKGIIAGYHADINLEKIGKNIFAILKITVNHSQDVPEETIEKIMELPHVSKVCTLTGEWDYQINVAVRNTKELKQVTTRIIKEAVPHIIRSDTSLVLLEKQKPVSA